LWDSIQNALNWLLTSGSQVRVLHGSSLESTTYKAGAIRLFLLVPHSVPQSPYVPNLNQPKIPSFVFDRFADRTYSDLVSVSTADFRLRPFFHPRFGLRSGF